MRRTQLRSIALFILVNHRFLWEIPPLRIVAKTVRGIPMTGRNAGN